MKSAMLLFPLAALVGPTLPAQNALKQPFGGAESTLDAHRDGWSGQAIPYEDRTLEGFRFQGWALPADPAGKDPKPFPNHPEAGGCPTFHHYRILQTGPAGASCLREVDAADLAWARGQGEDGVPDVSRGLFLLAFNPDRQEAYFTSVVEAARTMTREIYAVPWSGRPIRFLGTFTTAGEGLADLRISPSGDYVAFLSLWGDQVPQGLTVVRLESEQVRGWPTDQEVQALCRRYPSSALTITGYRWEDGDRLVFQQQIEPNPESCDGSGSQVPPIGQDFALEKSLDVRAGQVVQERKVPLNRNRSLFQGPRPMSLGSPSPSAGSCRTARKSPAGASFSPRS